LKKFAQLLTSVLNGIASRNFALLGHQYFLEINILPVLRGLTLIDEEKEESDELKKVN
jgi:hypothetical protein